MKRTILTSIFCTTLASFGCGTANATPPGEKARDRQALREDRRELAADRWDLARLEATEAAYRGAAARGDVATMGDLDRRVMIELAIELGESRRELVEKQQEVHDPSQSRPLDDRRDRNHEGATWAAKRQVRERYHDLLGRFDAVAVRGKLDLIGEALRLARAEIVGDRREKREDRRELRRDTP